MKRFNYIWKSSDGVRHVDSARATSREELFSSLRRDGIKAIKVEEIVPGYRKFMRIATYAILLGVVAGSLLIAYRATSGRSSARMSQSDSKNVSEFFTAADQIIKDYIVEHDRIKKEQGYREPKLTALIDLTRARVRLAHHEAAKTLRNDSAARRTLYRRYGEITEYLDEQELALEDVDL